MSKRDKFLFAGCEGKKPLEEKAPASFAAENPEPPKMAAQDSTPKVQLLAKDPMPAERDRHNLDRQPEGLVVIDGKHWSRYYDRFGNEHLSYPPDYQPFKPK